MAIRQQIPNEYHTHELKPFQTKNSFEPIPTSNQPIVYLMNEYTYLACKCGYVVKSRVKEQQD